jgi:type I restriction enzyme, S subunit
MGGADTIKESLASNVPTLRFPAFGEEWDPQKGGDVFKNSRTKGEAGLPIYSVTLDRGMVRRDSLERQMGADAADDSNLRVQKDELAYNMMRMWQGAVGKAPEECMVSPAYVVLSPRNETSSDFFDQWFKSAKALYKLWAYSHGLTSDRLRLYFKDFAQIPIIVPSPPEQKKIAAFLGAVDEKLTALQRKRDLLRDYKRGAMQQLFSQKIRFKKAGGADFPDWVEKRLGSIGDTVNGLVGKSGEDFGTGKQYITYKQVFDKSFIDPLGCGRVQIGQGENQNALVRGDILFTTSSETPNEVGFASVLLENIDELYLNSFCFALRPKQNDDLVPEFSRYLFRSHNYRRIVFPLAQGSTRYNLAKSSFKKLSLDIPHPEEQQKIAAFLSAIDAKSDAVAAQIVQVGAFKKGLLQQMFV